MHVYKSPGMKQTALKGAQHEFLYLLPSYPRSLESALLLWGGSSLSLSSLLGGGGDRLRLSLESSLLLSYPLSLSLLVEGGDLERACRDFGGGDSGERSRRGTGDGERSLPFPRR